MTQKRLTGPSFLSQMNVAGKAMLESTRNNLPFFLSLQLDSRREHAFVLALQKHSVKSSSARSRPKKKQSKRKQASRVFLLLFSATCYSWREKSCVSKSGGYKGLFLKFHAERVGYKGLFLKFHAERVARGAKDIWQTFPVAFKTP